jgi:hypothetical protein
MEKIVELLLFIFFIALTGLSATSKKAKEKHGSSEPSRGNIIPDIHYTENSYSAVSTVSVKPIPIYYRTPRENQTTHSATNPCPDSSPAPVSTEPAGRDVARNAGAGATTTGTRFEPPTNKMTFQELIRKNKQQTSPVKFPKSNLLKTFPACSSTPVPAVNPIISNPLTETSTDPCGTHARGRSASEIIQPHVPNEKRSVRSKKYPYALDVNHASTLVLATRYERTKKCRNLSKTRFAVSDIARFSDCPEWWKRKIYGKRTKKGH